MGRVLNLIGMGRPMAAAALWGVYSIGLAWGALWLRQPYGACANTFGMGRHMAAATQWGVLNMFGMGRPMAAAALWGVC